MAVIERVNTGARYELDAHSTVGRSRKSVIVLDHQQVSALHALIFWNGSVWMLRDLGSRNGTSVNEHLIASSTPVPLQPGAVIAFGHREQSWRFVNATPPLAFAESADRQRRRVAKGGMIALPDDDDMEVAVYRTEDGHWVAEQDERTQSVADGDPIEAGGVSWSLNLPMMTEQTAAPDTHVGPQLNDMKVRFAVSQDEEHVAVQIDWSGGNVRLPYRVHLYTLVTLARIRLADGAEVRASEDGWIDIEQLVTMLRLDRATLNKHLWRVRQQFLAAGVKDAARLIERRPHASKVRIGLLASQLEVIKIAEQAASENL